MTEPGGCTLSVVIDLADLAAGDDAMDAALPGDGPILVFDPDAWHRLVRRWPGRRVIAAADVLHRPAHVSALADDLFAGWMQHAAVEWDGWPLMELAAYRHVRWARRLAAVAAPLADAIGALRPRRVRVLAGGSGHALDGPADHRRRPILAGLAADVARARGLEVLTSAAVGVPGAAVAPALADEHPTAGDDGVPATPVEHAVTEFPAGHVLFVGDGPERSRHGQLGRQLAGRSGRPVRHVVRGGAPDGDAVREDVYAGPRPDVAVPAAAASRDRLLAAAADAAPDEPLSLLAGPGVRSHVDFLLGQYVRALAGNVRRWSRALDRHRPAAVVAGYPEIALEVAARQGRPTVLLPHGPMMLGEDRYHRCLPTTVRIGAVGPRHRRMLETSGIAADRIRVTGVPGSAADEGVLPRSPVDGRRFRILVPTSESWRPSQVGSLPVTSFTREHAALRRLVAAAWARGWTVELRPHPRYDRDLAFYRDAADSGIRDGTAEIRPPAERPWRDALAACDVVVFPGAPSSAAPEAARAGRPVLLLTEPAIVPFRRRWGLGGLVACPDVDALVAVLRRLAQDPATWRAAAAASRRIGERLLAPGGTASAMELILAAAGGRVSISPADVAGKLGRSGTGRPIAPA